MLSNNNTILHGPDLNAKMAALGSSWGFSNRKYSGFGICLGALLLSLSKLHPVFKANQRLWQTQGMLPTEKPECLI
jgi:hypothetical protein